jgi:hypothetical protein
VPTDKDQSTNRYTPKAMTYIDVCQLRNSVAARFYAVNGTHPMTPEDDSYVTEWYVPLDALAESAGIDVTSSCLSGSVTNLDRGVTPSVNGTGTSGDTMYVFVMSCLKQSNARTSL